MLILVFEANSTTSANCTFFVDLSTVACNEMLRRQKKYTMSLNSVNDAAVSVILVFTHLKKQGNHSGLKFEKSAM